MYPKERCCNLRPSCANDDGRLWPAVPPCELCAGRGMCREDGPDAPPASRTGLPQQFFIHEFLDELLDAHLPHAILDTV
eukprot:scaffold1802_cov138-Pinguiococcus_pyrenoidosus.AAC.3